MLRSFEEMVPLSKWRCLIFFSQWKDLLFQISYNWVSVRILAWSELFMPWVISDVMAFLMNSTNFEHQGCQK